jgi:glucokinase
MVGFDVGGTKVAAGRVSRDGRLSGESRVVASGARDVAAVVESIVETGEGVMRDAASAGENVVGVGIGCAGTVDLRRGLVVTSPNLPLTDAPLAALVGDRLGLPVFLDNDANVAAWAEVQVGAARGCRHVVMLALGTGVGGGLVLDGRLYRGATGAAGEIGHMIIVAGGEPCRCGARGCLEAYASGRALERIARRLVDDLPATEASALRAAGEQGTLTGKAVGDLALSGDPAALFAVDEVGRWLGIGLSNMVNIFNPDMIVVGGGLGDLGELLLAPARAALGATGLVPGKDTVRVTSALLGNDAGMLGAGLLAWAEMAGA